MQSSPADVRLRPLRVTELLDTVFSLYRRNFWLFVAIVAVVQVPYQVIDDLLSLAAPTTHFKPVAGRALSHAQLNLVLHNAALLLAVAAILVVLSVAVVVPLQTAAFTKAVSERFLGRPATTGACYRFAVRRWGALVALGLIYLGLSLGALIVLFLLGALLVVLLGPVGAVAAGLVGLAALVAGVICYVRILVASPALVLEGIGPWTSIRRSWALTSGNAGRAFGVSVSLVLVELLVTALLGIVFGIPAGLVGLGTGAGILIRDLGTLIIGVLVAPILAGGLTLLYFDLRVRKEAFDLELLAQQLVQGSGSD
ncbi:MAG: hypothetical protein ACYCYK_10360 [Candidatus Dormibacteria bacterium]